MELRPALGFLAVGAAACLAIARPGSAAELIYQVPTSTPEGLAVCSFKGAIKGADGGTVFQAEVVPTAGEGALAINVRDNGSGLASAGLQPGCDIFPNTPSQLSIPVAPSPFKVKFYGVLNLHAHPGSDCASASVGTGTVAVSVSAPATLKSPKLKCDNHQEHANLRLVAGAMPTGTRGEPLTGSLLIENHGPGDATGVELEVKLPKSFFPTEANASQGACIRDFQKHRVHCSLGTQSFFGNPTSQVDLEVIPLKTGVVKTTEIVKGTNNGKVFDKKDTIATDVAKGSSSILSVTLKCKGAAGTVTINPNGSGGVSTCTCPDPNDATKEEVTCIEVYAQKTTVTLTPNATTGQFDKWKGACAGNPAACNVTVDPAAQNPDASTTAKFK